MRCGVKFILSIIASTILASCGPSRDEFKLAYTIQNVGSNQATASIELRQYENADRCSTHSLLREYELNPATETSGELTILCNSDPEVVARGAVWRPQDLHLYAATASFTLADGATVPASVRVYDKLWHVAFDLPLVEGTPLSELQTSTIEDQVKYSGPAAIYSNDDGFVTVSVSDSKPIGDVGGVGMSFISVAPNEFARRIGDDFVEETFAYEHDGRTWRSKEDYFSSITITCDDESCSFK